MKNENDINYRLKKVYDINLIINRMILTIEGLKEIRNDLYTKFPLYISIRISLAVSIKNLENIILSIEGGNYTGTKSIIIFDRFSEIIKTLTEIENFLIIREKKEKLIYNELGKRIIELDFLKSEIDYYLFFYGGKENEK